MTAFGVVQLTSVTAADFNSDGKLDLAVTKVLDGSISILFNDGTGAFPTDGSTAPTIPVGSVLTAIKAGDFNNDTKADLIAIVSDSNTYAVLLGNGNGTFTNIGGGPLQSGLQFLDDLDVGDFNGDSKLDLAIIRAAANEVRALQGDGTGHFSDYAVVPLAGTPVWIVAGFEGRWQRRHCSQPFANRKFYQAGIHHRLIRTEQADLMRPRITGQTAPACSPAET